MRPVDIFIQGERNEEINKLFTDFAEKTGMERNFKNEGHTTKGTSSYMHLSFNFTDRKERELMLNAGRK